MDGKKTGVSRLYLCLGYLPPNYASPAMAMNLSRRMEQDLPNSLSGDRYEGRHVSAVSAWSSGRRFRLASYGYKAGNRNGARSLSGERYEGRSVQSVSIGVPTAVFAAQLRIWGGPSEQSCFIGMRGTPLTTATLP